MTPDSKQSSASRFSWLHPKAYLGIHAVVGLLVAAASTWAFFAMADEISEKGAMVRVDMAVTNWLQSHGTETGESIYSAISFFGAQGLIALLVIVGLALVVRRDWRRLTALVVTCGGGAALNGALKLAFHRARPSFASEFHEKSWSFPSGHAMDSLIVYGVFAFWLTERFPRARLPIALGAALLVGAIGFARIYLGVHYLSDVLAGFSAGVIWLAVCISGYRFAERRRLGSAKESDAPGA